MIMASELLISRIARIRPDLIFVVSGLALPMQVWDWLREFNSNLVKKFRTMLFLTESPYIDDDQMEILGLVDMAATIDKASVNRLRETNENTVYIRHAFNPVVHRVTPRTEQYASDVFFVGTGFPERVEMLGSIDWSGIDYKIFGDMWDMYPGGENIKDGTVLAYLDNAYEVPKYYSNAAISLNIFRKSRWPGERTGFIDDDEAYSISPRCYEIMGCGGFLLTNSRPELFDLFEDGTDLVTFESADDMSEKIRYYLDHENEREKIARSGWYAVREHTYANRAAEITSFVRDKLEDF